MKGPFNFQAGTRQVVRSLGRIALVAGWLAGSLAVGANPDDPVRYLAFQIFTAGAGSAELGASFPPAPDEIRKTVTDLREAIGTTGVKDRHLGFVLGPLAFDTPDEQVRALVRQGFDLALETGVAVGFHVDDSMFWGRRDDLNTAKNLEWVDWDGPPSTGRRLDWSQQPLKIMPPLCFNSPAVRQAVAARAALIGQEVARGVQRLRAAQREVLFLGVIAGWETQLGRDFDTGRSVGYHALTLAGFSRGHPPADPDLARVKIVEDFIGFWARSLAGSGVPPDKVYSHIAFTSEVAYAMAGRAAGAAGYRPYLQAINFTPPASAFAPGCVPGFSTYPQPGQLEHWQRELAKHGHPFWASSEGTALDPGEADRGGRAMAMDAYLGNLFNHGARLVNIFGWGVGPRDNPFRRTAESGSALAAYRKFLRGEPLPEAPVPVPRIPPADLAGKIHRIQSLLPGWINRHGPGQAGPLMGRLDEELKGQQFDEAAKTADEVLALIARDAIGR